MPENDFLYSIRIRGEQLRHGAACQPRHCGVQFKWPDASHVVPFETCLHARMAVFRRCMIVHSFAPVKKTILSAMKNRVRDWQTLRLLLS